MLAPFVIPGETAAVETEPSGKNMLRARTANVTAPSPDRVDPPCPYFHRCGGCHYQHARYEYQVARKADILREQLRRVGRIDYQGEIETISGPDLGYRNRTQFHVNGRQIGYFSEGTHRLVPIEQCPISSPKINQALAALVAMTGDRRWPQFLKQVEVFTNEEQVQLNVLEAERPLARSFFDWCAERIPSMAQGTLDYRVGEQSFRIGRRSFFQVNRFLIDRLVETALGGASGRTALDLYAGVGLFSVNLARRFATTTAVESGRGAVADAQYNAEKAGVSIHTAHENVERYLPQVKEAPDFILADPPRAGLGKQTVAELTRLAAPRLHIVACDPATLARDLSGLLSVGYRIDRAVMVDLFPHTYHIEAIVSLIRS